MSISASELGYIKESLKQDYRQDGRTRLDWRALSVARSVARSANGSARCRLGGTDVLAACRLEVEEVEQGSLECFVEWCVFSSMCFRCLKV
jgi:exosome complex component RRP42